MKKTVDFAINHMHKMPTTNTPYKQKKKKRNQKIKLSKNTRKKLLKTLKVKRIK